MRPRFCFMVNEGFFRIALATLLNIASRPGILLKTGFRRTVFSQKKKKKRKKRNKKDIKEEERKLK